MTTIATDHKIIATDTQILYWGYLRGKTTKINHLPEGTIIACAGSGDSEWRAMQFFSDPLWPGKDPILFRGEDDAFEAILWWNKRLYVCCSSTVPNPLLDPYFAVGSGAAYAMAAMALGKSPIEAVKFASKFDVNTNNKVKTCLLETL